MKVHKEKVGKLLDPPSANISAISTKQVIYQITAATCGLVGRTLQSVSTADTTQQIGSRHASPEQEVMSTLSKLHQHYNIKKLVCLRSPFFSSLEFYSFCKKLLWLSRSFQKHCYIYIILLFSGLVSNSCVSIVTIFWKIQCGAKVRHSDRYTPLLYSNHW